MSSAAENSAVDLKNKKNKIKKSIPNNDSLKRANTYDSFTNNKMETYYNEKDDIQQINTVMAINNSSAQVHFNGGSAEELKSTLWSMISQNGTVLTCTVCGKSKDKRLDKEAKKHIVSHVESMHTEGVLYECNKCDKTCRSKNALHKHTQQIHNRH